MAGITTDYAYTYDAAGRLLTVIKDGQLVEEYAYNANGSRTYELNVLRGIKRDFSYSMEDHLLAAGTTTYDYDPDGFLTRKTEGTAVTTYDYSSRGELLGVSLPDGTVVEYIHAPLGRRIAKKVNGAITEKYLWSGRTTLLAVYDGADTLLMRFEYADGRMPAAVVMEGVTYYLVYDQIGSLRAVGDGAGNVVKRIDYDAFGNIVEDSNPLFEIPFGFAGGLHDRDTGLVRFGYRDYDPAVGRWTAKDPILFAGGDTDLFGYCLSDPVNLIDPSGNLSFFGGVMGGIVGGIGGVLGGLANENISKSSLVNAFVGGFAGGFIAGMFDVKAGIGAGIGAAVAASYEAAKGGNLGAIVGASVGGGLGGALAGYVGGLQGVAVGTQVGGAGSWAFALLGGGLYENASDSSCK